MDSLRLAVTPVVSDPTPGGFEVQIFVNDVEMTTAGAGMGMDPYDILIPDNRLLATPEPRSTPVARCGCGVYGCGSTAVMITRDVDVVHWDWLLEIPMNRRVTFSAAAYDREVDRARADTAWETPGRTAGRLILTAIDDSLLRRTGLQVAWAAPKFDDPDLFRIALQNDTHQVFLDLPWRNRSPADLAAEAVHTLGSPPSTWSVSWRPMLAGDGPPQMASPAWVLEPWR